MRSMEKGMSRRINQEYRVFLSESFKSSTTDVSSRTSKSRVSGIKVAY